MSDEATRERGVLLHQILSVFDDVRRMILKEVSTPHQKKLYGLTIRQSSAINQVMLLMKEQPDGVALKTLAKHMQMAVSATSILVENMVSRGFFERTPNPLDRRAICIRLSAKGEAIFRETHELLLNKMTQLSDSLSEEDMASLSQIANKLKGKTFV